MVINHEYGLNGDKKLRYNMVEGVGPSLADYVGQRFKIKCYVLFTNDPKAEGEEPVKVIKVMLEDGQIAGTTSKSFINSFERYLDCIESDECDEMEVQQMRSSKTGRPYLVFKA